MNPAKEYLKGRGIDDIKVNGVQLSRVMNAFGKTISNSEKKHYQYYPFKLAVAHKHGYKSVKDAICALHKKCKYAIEVAELFDMTKAGINAKLREWGVPRKPVGGNQHKGVFDKKNYTRISSMAKEREMAIDDFLKDAFLTYKTQRAAAAFLGIDRTTAGHHKKRIGL